MKISSCIIKYGRKYGSVNNKAFKSEAGMKNSGFF